MSLTILDAAAVRRLLPMADCIEAMRQAMLAVSRGQVAIPPRIIAPLPDGSGHFAAMPGSTESPAMDGAKLLTLLPANPAAGRPAIQGVVLLFDHATGAPQALLNGAEITALRTAAASGLATQLLARNDARSHGVLGTGVQAGVHIDAIRAVRPGITAVRVWGRDADRTKLFALRQSERTGLDVQAVADAAEACACDVVSAVTGATHPVLQGARLMPGAHVNLVGAHQATHREADSLAITRAAIYVDLMESALREAGDLLIPMGEGAFAREGIVGEIGEVAAGTVPGRTGDTQITLYKSLGVVAQDLYAARAVLQRALAQGQGVTVPF
jgi:ornithine cyclodeaminase